MPFLMCFKKTHVSCSRWALRLVTAAKPCDHQGQGGPITSMFSMFLLKCLLVKKRDIFQKTYIFHFSFLRRLFGDFSVFSCYLGCASKTHVSCSRWALGLVTAAKPCDHQGQGGHVFHVPSQISLFFRPSGATLKNDDFSTGPKIHKIDDEIEPVQMTQ